MDETPLYQQIAERIRQDILEGRFKPGDRLPSVRQMREEWHCTPGTVQRAYNKLAREGLLVSRAGQGTLVAGGISESRGQEIETLRRAHLVHRSEAFLLEALTGGYALDEIQLAMDMAMDRWRALASEHITEREKPSVDALRFSGSHDMVLNDLAHTFFGRQLPGCALRLHYTGSLGGLIALAEGSADLAGCHLWDAETGQYNLPFVRRLLPNRAVTGVTLAHRRLGLILTPGNPLKIGGLSDLARPEVRYVNRQAGSGTRVWLDAALHKLGVPADKINGYSDERMTHSDVARAVAEGVADVGLGLEAAARAYGLDFHFLIRERYDLVMLAETAQRPPVRALIAWLESPAGKKFVDQHRGYESQETGQTWQVE